MSDVFDHALDAFESEWDCAYGDRPDYPEGSHVRSKFYEEYRIVSVRKETSKAFLLEMEEAELPFIGDQYDVKENTVLVWVPKSVIRGVVEDDTYVSIHSGILCGCLRNCIPKQKELWGYKEAAPHTTKKELFLPSEREAILAKLPEDKECSPRELKLVALIKMYEKKLRYHNL